MTFHNNFIRFFDGLIIACVIFAFQEAKADLSQSDAIKREQSLIAANNTTDSIKILLDVYNLSDRLNRDRVRKQLINLASKSDNQEVIGDVVNELASTTDDARELKRLIEISENLPDKNDHKNARTVLQMEQAQAEAPSIGDSQLKEQIMEYKRQGPALSGDPYKDIQNIYRTMVYLGTASQGAMYYEYIKRLEELVEDLPEEDHAIKNLFYTNAAIFYTRKRDYAKAIDSDKKLIEQLDKIKKLYQAQGKDTEELDYFYYVSYRRMLRNFPGLTPAQVENVYNKCVELAQNDEKAMSEYVNSGLAKSYYYMATGRYKEAIPELHKALNYPEISKFRQQELTGLLSWALRHTGDKNAELEALREYSAMMFAEREERREGMYKEIELRNSVNKVLSDEYRVREQQRHENQVMRKTSLTLVYVLAVVLIFICGAYFRLRNRVKELEIKNSKLRKNIEYIFDDGVPKGSKDLRHQKNRLKG